MTVTQSSREARSRLRSPRVVLVDRGDPVVTPMAATMAGRLHVVGRVDVELSTFERLFAAGLTFRPGKVPWTENFYKSNWAVARRSRRAQAELAVTAATADVVFQTHALFETGDPRTVMYVDCTHRQSMEQWPAWNPLRGRRLARWLERETRQYHQAAHLFTFSVETARFLVEHYHVPDSRVTVVGAGVNFEQLPAPRRSHRGPPTVLFVGNDFERKGGPRLLDAMALLRLTLL